MCGIFRVKRQELENRTTMSIILNALSIFCCTTIKSERIAIIWSDNRKSQYKWRFSFIKTGTIGDRFDGLRFEHKYAQQSRFQGPWDAAGKRAKEYVRVKEKEGKRSPNARACFELTEKHLSSEGDEKWKTLEQNCEPGLVQKTPFKQDSAFFGVVTNDEKEYKEMKVSHAHIVLLQRDEVDDTKPLNGSNKFHQTRSENSPISTAPNHSKYEKVWALYSSNPPCSCPIYVVEVIFPSAIIVSLVVHAAIPRISFKLSAPSRAWRWWSSQNTCRWFHSILNEWRSNLLRRYALVPTPVNKNYLVHALRNAIGPVQPNNDNLNWTC